MSFQDKVIELREFMKTLESAETAKRCVPTLFQAKVTELREFMKTLEPAEIARLSTAMLNIKSIACTLKGFKSDFQSLVLEQLEEIDVTKDKEFSDSIKAHLADSKGRLNLIIFKEERLDVVKSQISLEVFYGLASITKPRPLRA